MGLPPPPRESEVEKTARFTRHAIQAIIVIAIIIAVVIGSIILIGLYEVHQTVNSVNQAMPLTTIKVSTQDVTVNVPFTVTITTNQIKNYNDIYYSISGYGSDYTGINPPYSGMITTKTLTFQMVITENDYQNLNYANIAGAGIGYISTDLTVMLTSGAYNIGVAYTNINIYQ